MFLLKQPPMRSGGHECDLCRGAVAARVVRPRSGMSAGAESFVPHHEPGKTFRQFDALEAAHRPHALFDTSMVPVPDSYSNSG